MTSSSYSFFKTFFSNFFNLQKALHFNTFGGNPLACAVGMEVLNVIEDEKIQQNCEHVGEYYIAKMKKLMDKYEFIGDVRGKVKITFFSKICKSSFRA